MHTFYIPDKVSQTAHLSDEESKHAVRVLRLTKGDDFRVLDGQGGLFECMVTDANVKRCGFRILNESIVPKRPYYINLCIAPTKNLDRMEWLVEKCTEIGIDRISFFHSEYSQRKVMKLDRLIKKSISALKQSHNYYLPELNPLVSFESLFDSIQEDNNKYIAYLDKQRQTHLIQAALPGKKYSILIGPEGDFSEKEIEIAMKNDFHPVSLGSSTLRTETAGVYACSALNMLNHSV